MDLEGRATHINRSRRRGAEKDTSERENGRRERGGLKRKRDERPEQRGRREKEYGERERERWPERPEKESRGESLMRATIQCVGRRQRAECSRLPAFRNLFSPPSASFVLSPDNMPLRERERERDQFAGVPVCTREVTKSTPAVLPMCVERYPVREIAGRLIFPSAESACGIIVDRFAFILFIARSSAF